jgi:hypothetical protein
MNDVRAGFNLGGNTIWGIALRDKLLGLVQMFVRPYANILPIAVSSLNSLYCQTLFSVAEQRVCSLLRRANHKRDYISYRLPYQQDMQIQARSG